MLSLLDDSTYADLSERRRGFTDGLRGEFASVDTKAQVAQVGTLSGLFFADAPVNDYGRRPEAADHARYARFFHGMLERGVFLPPSGYETMLRRASPTPTPSSTPSSTPRPQSRAATRN